MNWKPYPAYKDSGVEWLGEIPEHWEVKRLKFVSKLRSGDSITSFDIDENGNYPVYGGNGLRGYTAAYSHEGEFVLIGRQGALCGCINYAVGRFWASEHAVVATPTGQTAVRWLGELLRSMNLNRYSQSAAQPGLAVETIAALLLPVPPIQEQHSIVAFLDRETQRIDTLIAKKERQVELLKEKRAALISHAVTKGLDPNAKMKDSGVEWLGEVPEHWEVKRIKRIGNIKYGLGEQPRQFDEGLPMIRATDISVGKINMNTVQRVDPDDVPWSRDPALRANDILLVRSGAYTGDSAIVPSGLAGAIAGYDMVLRVNRAEPGYVAYALLSKYLLQGQIYLDKLRAAQPHLNAEEFGSCIILLPPKPEQEEIVSHLDKETTSIDNLSEKIEWSIAALREYRSALISAAVTGKIDVRQEASI